MTVLQLPKKPEGTQAEKEIDQNESALLEQRLEDTEKEESPEGEESAPAPESQSTPKSYPHSEPYIVLLVLWDIFWFTAKVCARGIVATSKATFFYLRYHPFHFLLTALLLFLLSLMVITSSGIHAKMIMGEISDETVEELIQASRYTRSHSLVRMKKLGAEELIQVGGPTWAQREGVRAVLFQARRAGLSIEDQAVLLATVEVESGFNPMAKAPTTTACGLFQFVKATGQAYNLAQADCMDPSANAKAGIAHYLDNYNRTVANQVSHLEGPEKVFKTYELSYYLHHDGPNSSNPNNDVKAVVLNGTEFLFRAYEILKREELSRRQAPSFLDRFTEHLFEVLHRMTEYIPFLNATEVHADGREQQKEVGLSSDLRAGLRAIFY